MQVNLEPCESWVQIPSCLWVGRDSATSNSPDGEFSQPAPRGARLALRANSHNAAVCKSLREQSSLLAPYWVGRDLHPRRHNCQCVYSASRLTTSVPTRLFLFYPIFLIFSRFCFASSSFGSSSKTTLKTSSASPNILFSR